MHMLKNWEFWALPLAIGALLFMGGLSGIWVYDAINRPDPVAAWWIVRAGVVLMAVGVLGVLGCLFFQDGVPRWISWIGRIRVAIKPVSIQGASASGVVVPTSAELAMTNEELWARSQEQIEGRNEVIRKNEALIDKLSKELTETRKALSGSQRRIETQQIQISARDEKIGALEQIASWATSLIERERGASTMLDYKAHVWGINLDDREPYLEIAVFLDYSGVLEVVIGKEQSGRLSWDGKAFVQEPVVSMGTGTRRPFKFQGPMRLRLMVRQYMSKESASEIKAYLDRGVPEIEFVSQDFELSIEKIRFDGKMLSAGRLFGEYLAAENHQGSFKPPW